jgi:hypothetical protein
LLGKKQYGHLFEFPINYQIGSGWEYFTRRICSCTGKYCLGYL